MGLIILAAVVLGLIYLRPDLDETREGHLLLWYGRYERKYIILWKRRT